MRNTLFAFIGLGACLLGSISSAQAQNVDWQKVDETLGRSPPSRTTSIATAFPAAISP